MGKVESWRTSIAPSHRLSSSLPFSWEDFVDAGNSFRLVGDLDVGSQVPLFAVPSSSASSRCVSIHVFLVGHWNGFEGTCSSPSRERQTKRCSSTISMNRTSFGDSIGELLLPRLCKQEGAFLLSLTERTLRSTRREHSSLLFSAQWTGVVRHNSGLELSNDELDSWCRRRSYN